MAPEQLEKHGHYNEKVDIWALGHMFYQIMAGDDLVKEDDFMDG